MIESIDQEIITFTPGLTVDDPLGKYWLHQAIIMLRREICWCRVERGIDPENSQQYLPLFMDKESQILAMSKFSDLKKEFQEFDPTAKYLTSLLNENPPNQSDNVNFASFSWLVQTLKLDNVSCFLLALGLIGTFDSAVGAIIAICLNDPSKKLPTMALAQKLWTPPEELYDIVNPNHPLVQHGILRIENLNQKHSDLDWESPITVPAIIANQLLFPNKPLISGLCIIAGEESKTSGKTSTSSIQIVASRIKSSKKSKLKIAPIRASLGGSYEDILNEISELIGRAIVRYTGDPCALLNPSYLKSIIAYCWLRDVDLFLSLDIIFLLEKNADSLIDSFLSLKKIPITIYLGITEKEQLKTFPRDLLFPIIDIPIATYQDRVNYWQEALKTEENDGKTEEIIYKCARRFQFEKETIRAICEGLNQSKKPLTKTILFDACRVEVSLEDVEFAQAIVPRFENEEIILPPKQKKQFSEIITAMRSLTKVYYDWEMAKVWNEGGITCLFAGPSGTGKTMAAEILAQKLDLPMYRIDLSQVLNKYIGETEKNLKRLFDFAEISDTILFFDEADALFGRRTEIKDAHDRYANITVSYLLERMERFKGLAILATNQKKNLDESFTRRIRYIIDFPIPEYKERLRIWQQVVPEVVDRSVIDFEFLAKQFALSGGNIRSIIFNASLQSVGKKNQETTESKDKISMNEIIIAVKREYDKMNRSIGLEQFGSYVDLIKQIEGGSL